jgi:ABC-2 type transport system ATP-binding protein
VGEVMKLVRRQVVLQISIAGDQQPAARLLEQHPHVQQIELRDGLVSVTLREGITDYSDFAGLLISAGHKLTLLREDELNLETAFMALTKGITA